MSPMEFYKEDLNEHGLARLKKGTDVLALDERILNLLAYAGEVQDEAKDSIYPISLLKLLFPEPLWLVALGLP